MKQHGLTILSPIDKAQLADLDTLLRAIGNDITKQTRIPFSEVTLLHFASWVIFADGRPGPQLIFESNFDGPSVDFLRQLTDRAQIGLDEIYRHCADYSAGRDGNSIFQYLRAHVVATDTFYVSCGGFTRRQIVQENELREKIESFLGRLPDQQDAAAVRRSIQEFVRNDNALAWARQPAEPYPFLERARIRDLLILVCVLVMLLSPLLLGWKAWGLWIGILAILFVAVYGILRWKEARDPSISDTAVENAQPDPVKVQQLVGRENRRPQNHLFSITTVKPGVFRFALLKVVLALIEILGRLKFYRGILGGIPSIHFARWAMINDGKHLLFLSNFDGSWEHYLGEFIDQAANGLTAVWSNALNFPRTWNLIQGGARDEQRFKSYARRMQLYTQLWYSAYPFLSVVNVQNNAAIRAGLWEALDADALEAWLRRF